MKRYLNQPLEHHNRRPQELEEAEDGHVQRLPIKSLAGRLIATGHFGRKEATREGARRMWPAMDGSPPHTACVYLTVFVTRADEGRTGAAATSVSRRFYN